MVKNSVSNKAWMDASISRSADADNEDFYTTDPTAVSALLRFNDNNKFLSRRIWECACGDGAISKMLIQNGFSVVSSDLYNRGFGKSGVDFLASTVPHCDPMTDKPFSGGGYDIVTNPPYKQAIDFVTHSLDVVPNGHSVSMLVRLGFLEGAKRYHQIYQLRPPKHVLVFSRRIKCYKNGIDDGINSAVCYAWFIWRKNQDGSFDRTTTLHWI